MNATAPPNNEIDLTIFQTLLLATVVTKDANKTAGALQAALIEDTRTAYNHAQIYKALDRLLDLKLIKAHAGKAEPGHKGTAPQTYSITTLGVATLKQKIVAHNTLAAYLQTAVRMAGELKKTG